MKEPSQEEIKRFWEHWGVKPEKVYEQTYLQQGAYYLKYPPITLNNLFLYVVPKLGIHLNKIEFHHSDYYGYRCHILYYQEYQDDLDIDSGLYKDPALALFWTLDKVREGES